MATEVGVGGFDPPEDCIEPIGGRDYWRMVRDPSAFDCALRAWLEMHPIRCPGCLSMSLAISRQMLEAALKANAAANTSS